MISTLLDPRTVNCFHLKDRLDVAYECKDKLSAEYVNYGMCYNETAATSKAMLAAKVNTDTAAVLAKISSGYGSTPAHSGGTAAVSALIPKKSERTIFTEDSTDEETQVEEVNPAAAAKALVEAKAAELSALKEKLKTEFDRVFKAYRKAALVVTLPFLTPYNNALNFIYN